MYICCKKIYIGLHMCFTEVINAIMCEHGLILKIKSHENMGWVLETSGWTQYDGLIGFNQCLYLLSMIWIQKLVDRGLWYINDLYCNTCPCLWLIGYCIKNDSVPRPTSGHFFDDLNQSWKWEKIQIIELPM